MKIAQTYSHVNGEEYLIYHFRNLYDEIKKIINGIDIKIPQKIQNTEKEDFNYDYKELTNIFESKFAAKN